MQVPKTCLSNGLVQLKENDSGNAPILNYNLPQKSAFTSYSTNILKVPLEKPQIRIILLALHIGNLNNYEI